LGFGLALTGRGDYDQALPVFTEGLALAEKLRATILRDRVLNSLAWLYAECGDLERAIEFNEKGLGVSHQHDDPERSLGWWAIGQTSCSRASTSSAS
jgi:tetratricopeptide (TPR) repeat protein